MRDAAVALDQQVVKDHDERLMILHAHERSPTSARRRESATRSRRSAVRPGTNDLVELVAGAVERRHEPGRRERAHANARPAARRRSRAPTRPPASDSQAVLHPVGHARRRPGGSASPTRPDDRHVDDDGKPQRLSMRVKAEGTRQKAEPRPPLSPRSARGYISQPSTIPAADEAAEEPGAKRQLLGGLSRAMTAKTSDTKNANSSMSPKWDVAHFRPSARRRRRARPACSAARRR